MRLSFDKLRTAPFDKLRTAPAKGARFDGLSAHLSETVQVFLRPRTRAENAYASAAPNPTPVAAPVT